MHQTKKHSLLESIVNTITGILFNYLINLYILPLYGIKITNTQNFAMIFTFLILSTLKVYIIRRLFNKIKN